MSLENKFAKALILIGLTGIGGVTISAGYDLVRERCNISYNSDNYYKKVQIESVTLLTSTALYLLGRCFREEDEI